MTGPAMNTPHPAVNGAIVVGVDDSPNAAAAAAFARGLARRTGRSCHLVHVVEQGQDPVGAGLRVREAIGSVRPSLGADEIEVRVGRPAEILVDRATQLGAQLIVLGGKHHTLLSRWVAGSTAIDVVRHSIVPVLVTRGPVGAISRILVGADASPGSFGAIRHAEEWAEVWSAEVRVLHVVPLPPLLPEYANGYDLDALKRSGELRAQEEIWPLIGRRDTGQAVEIGSPAQVLAEQARAWQAELLVVARHDRNWLERAALGSVTERLLDGLPTSVLVIPAPQAERAQADVVLGAKEMAR